MSNEGSSVSLKEERQSCGARKKKREKERERKSNSITAMMKLRDEKNSRRTLPRRDGEKNRREGNRKIVTFFGFTATSFECTNESVARRARSDR